jgi:hypothetical protein
MHLNNTVITYASIQLNECEKHDEKSQQNLCKNIWNKAIDDLVNENYKK